MGRSNSNIRNTLDRAILNTDPKFIAHAQLGVQFERGNSKSVHFLAGNLKIATNISTKNNNTVHVHVLSKV